MALLLEESVEPKVVEVHESPGVFRGIVFCLVPGLVLWAFLIWGALALVDRLG